MRIAFLFAFLWIFLACASPTKPANPVADQIKKTTVIIEGATREIQETGRVLQQVEEKQKTTNRNLDSINDGLIRVNKEILIRNQIDDELADMIRDLQALQDPKINDTMLPHLNRLRELEIKLSHTR